jgi:hypothetical protein
MLDSTKGVAVTIEEARGAEAKSSPPPWLVDLRALVSPDCVLVDFETRLQHSRDRLPLGRFRHRSRQLTGTLPSAVVEPTSPTAVGRAFSVVRSPLTTR